MRSINFDDGNKSFCINDDESRVIRFNPGDLNITVRSKEALKRITEGQKRLEDVKLRPDGTIPEEEITDEACAVLEEFDQMLRTEINFIFNADVYDIAFNGQSPLCTVGKKKEFFFEAFVKAAMEFISEEFATSAQASQKRIEKYTKEYAK